MKPEMVSSYIFYHYQLQEERPACGNKYGLISITENLLFFYTEEPVVKEEALYDGRMKTANTPGNWTELWILFYHNSDRSKLEVNSTKT